MPDISMCSGKSCPVKKKCYRYKAKPSEYQSYFAEPPIKIKDGVAKCDYYWGDDADSVWQQLLEIVANKDKSA